MGQATFYYKNSNAPKPNKPNHIGATILINYDGKVLLESRKDSERWAFIGGGLFLNETLLECVKRETFEETGIILSDDDIEFCKLYDDPSIIIEYPDGNIIRSMMALYETTLKQMPDLRCSEESVELRFFSKEELKNIKIVETHTPILEDYFAECTNFSLTERLKARMNLKLTEEFAMRKIISKILGVFATFGAILIVLSNFFPEEGYILFWIGIVVMIFGGIAYLATGGKIKEWFWKIMDCF